MKTNWFLIALSAGAFVILSAAVPAAEYQPKRSMTELIKKTDYGKTADGTTIELYELRNRHGMIAKVMTYGATLTDIQVPDRHGKVESVTLGFADLASYLKGHPFFGSVAGRYANRIAKGKFSLNGKTYTLAVNNGPNHLHGGLKGFDKRIWKAVPIETRAGPAVKLTYTSADGEEGYPGNLSVTVIYTLTDRNELIIDYEATTDQDTVLNLTNHAYFNLGGPTAGDILDHELTILADQFTAVDDTSIPTGEIKAVKGTVWDFTKPTPIGARIQQVGGQPGGYDHNYVLRKTKTGKLELAVRAYEPKSGRVMEISTTEPGVQFYTGNYLDGSLTGLGGKVYKSRHGFCLETQHFPDSPNQPKFPSAVLKAGQTYRSTTLHKFSVK